MLGLKLQIVISVEWFSHVPGSGNTENDILDKETPLESQEHKLDVGDEPFWCGGNANVWLVYISLIVELSEE